MQIHAGWHHGRLPDELEQQDEQHNEDVDVIVTLFIPLTLIDGIYVVSSNYMPEIESRYGYYAVWGIIMSIMLWMFFFFRRKKWF